jgi:predicted metal-dependent HD superfamily phosphohydrolase
MSEPTDEDRNFLHRRWQSLTTAIDADPAASDTTWDALRKHYSEPHRAYHNLSHILALLRHADAEHAQIVQPETVELAIWFHDVIYDTRARDNEERSAIWACDALHAMGAGTELSAAVATCIRATQGHEASTSALPDLPLFLDIDLAILGAPEDVYDHYSRAIRAEYGWVGETAYKAGRGEVLKRFLARPALFHIPSIANRLEGRARHNIARELQQLASISTE